jgi:hypothetical protein
VKAIDQVIAICARESDWREVRDQIDRDLGYARFDGPCHIIPNHAMTLAALLLGGDDFQRALMIAASAGFDTDSNAGVVGCLNGIRLGLDAITAQVDFRAEVADRLLVVTADGGSCVSDAVLETRKIVAAALRGRPTQPGPAPRFGFEYRGSTQGFMVCPELPAPYPSVTVANASDTGETGLLLRCNGVGPGVEAAVSTPVFLDPAGTAVNFSTIASPTLYPGQRITLTARSEAPGPVLHLYELHRDAAGTVRRTESEPFTLGPEDGELSWVVPEIGPAPLFRFGLLVRSAKRFDGTVMVSRVDWRGAPQRFALDGILLSSIWDTSPGPLRAWVSSAANFEADFDQTFSVSHPHGLGLATIGSMDWDDYQVSSTVRFSLHRQAGLVARSVGHRRYYAAVFDGGNRVRLIRQHDTGRIVLAGAEFRYGQDVAYQVEFAVVGPRLDLSINGRIVLVGVDDGPQPYLVGGAGFLIDEGTMFADGFEIRALAGEEEA